MTLHGMRHVVGITERTADGGYVHPAPLSVRDSGGRVRGHGESADLAGHEFGPVTTDVVWTAGAYPLWRCGRASRRARSPNEHGQQMRTAGPLHVTNAVSAQPVLPVVWSVR